MYNIKHCLNYKEMFDFITKDTNKNGYDIISLTKGYLSEDYIVIYKENRVIW